MSTTSDNNKRIAKNTVMLYIRMFFTMAVSLFTSRVILQTLGVTDYGINNVVGGVVAMFSFLNGAMASATQRYLNVDIATGNEAHLKVSFRTAMQIHVLIALFILILAETVGLWFVLNKLVIPENRMYAAMWVYQFSIVASMVSIISLPYNAAIIAHERMSAFAYISIMDVVLKLWGSDNGNRRFYITVDGRRIAQEVVENCAPGQYYYARHAIPAELSRGKQSVTVKLESDNGSLVGGLFGLYTTIGGSTQP